MRAACDFRENDGAAGGEEGHLTARLVDLGAQLARCDGDIGARIAAREGNGGTRLDDGEAPAGRGDLRAVEHADRPFPPHLELERPALQHDDRIVRRRTIRYVLRIPDVGVGTHGSVGRNGARQASVRRIARGSPATTATTLTARVLRSIVADTAGDSRERHADPSPGPDDLGTSLDAHVGDREVGRSSCRVETNPLVDQSKYELWSDGSGALIGTSDRCRYSCSANFDSRPIRRSSGSGCRGWRSFPRRKKRTWRDSCAARSFTFATSNTLVCRSFRHQKRQPIVVVDNHERRVPVNSAGGRTRTS